MGIIEKIFIKIIWLSFRLSLCKGVEYPKACDIAKQKVDDIKKDGIPLIWAFIISIPIYIIFIILFLFIYNYIS